MKRKPKINEIIDRIYDFVRDEIFGDLTVNDVDNTI